MLFRDRGLGTRHLNPAQPPDKLATPDECQVFAKQGWLNATASLFHHLNLKTEVYFLNCIFILYVKKMCFLYVLFIFSIFLYISGPPFSSFVHHFGKQVGKCIKSLQVFTAFL